MGVRVETQLKRCVFCFIHLRVDQVHDQDCLCIFTSINVTGGFVSKASGSGISVADQCIHHTQIDLYTEF